MTTTLATLLEQGRQQLEPGSDSPQLDAEVLLGHVLHVGRASLYANPGQVIAAQQVSDYQRLIGERLSGRPVAQLTGQREFWSLLLKVTADVLVPRPETELLVERSLTHIEPDADLNILELGTGSGALAIAIASERKNCRITATDNCTAALQIAQDNAIRHAPGRIRFIHSDWFAELPAEKFDLIVSNPPYIATAEQALTDRELDFEPQAALYSGADGLDDIRKIITASPAYLHTGGWLLLEHGLNQASQVQQLLAHTGFTAIQSYADLAGIERITEAYTG